MKNKRIYAVVQYKEFLLEKWHEIDWDFCCDNTYTRVIFTLDEARQLKKMLSTKHIHVKYKIVKLVPAR